MKEYQPLDIRLLYLYKTDVVRTSTGGFWGGFVEPDDSSSGEDVDMPTVGIF